MGLLDIHQGLCGDPPCGVIRDVSRDQTGRLQFSSLIGKRWEFVGRLDRQAVIGMLSGERVRLRRDRDESPDLDRNTDAAAWCGFWTRVPRCGGVRELCASWGIPK